MHKALEFLRSFGPEAAADDRSMMHIGAISKKQVFRPWPTLFRHLGGDGSDRRGFVRSLVAQAIIQNHNVIALTADDPRMQYLMMDACAYNGRADKVHAGTSHGCSPMEMSDLIRRERLVNIDSNFSRRDTIARADFMLAVLNEHVQSADRQSQRTLIVLDEMLTYGCNGDILGRLLEACAQKNVTVLLTDRTSANDTPALIRQCDLLAIGSLEPEALAPLLQTLVIAKFGDLETLRGFHEGKALVAYRDYLHPPIFAQADLLWDIPPQAKAGTENEMLVRVGVSDEPR